MAMESEVRDTTTNSPSFLVNPNPNPIPSSKGKNHPPSKSLAPSLDSEKLVHCIAPASLTTYSNHCSTHCVASHLGSHRCHCRSPLQLHPSFPVQQSPSRSWPAASSFTFSAHHSWLHLITSHSHTSSSQPHTGDRVFSLLLPLFPKSSSSRYLGPSLASETPISRVSCPVVVSLGTPPQPTTSPQRLATRHLRARLSTHLPGRREACEIWWTTFGICR